MSYMYCEENVSLIVSITLLMMDEKHSLNKWLIFTLRVVENVKLFLNNLKYSNILQLL